MSIIKAEHISKSYQIAHEKQEGYTTLREAVGKQTKHLFQTIGNTLRGKATAGLNSEIQEFWALKDVSFEIKQGDRVGIIGKNGAGKSTLLKVLSRITSPTSGTIRIGGRVASLLEVGTGFHPELTGRENIFLNGAILGMTRNEIKSKFDEIVAFAEIEQFLDTPVKRYSSGMYVRLAFAVAAHLEPEILVVDEVLAVGDADFQRKCLGKMEDVSKNQGRTVLFVSHSMPTISSLCNRAILMEKGQVKLDGEVGSAILTYYSSGNASPTYLDYSNEDKKTGDAFAQLVKAGIYIDNQISEPEIDITQKIAIKMTYKILVKDDKILPYANFHLYNAGGVCVLITTPKTTQIHEVGEYETICWLPANLLNQGTYFVGLAVSSFGKGVGIHFYESNALSFNIRDDIYNVPTRLKVGEIVAYSGEIPGAIRPLLEWETQKIK